MARFLRRGTVRPALSEAPIDIIDHQLFEISGDSGAAQRHRLLAIDEHRSRRLLAGAGERNPDVGVFRFTRSVDDAAHDRDVERLDAGITALPLRHRGMDEALDVASELLKSGRGCPPATRTSG